jgi:hypothetical protein
MSRPAAISRTIMQKLEMNTVATGMKIEKKFSGLPVLDFSFCVI